jgi:hydroxymethylbilane synthase
MPGTTKDGKGRGRGTIIIATRSSELALYQARLVQSLLAEHGAVSELKTYKTVGDKRLDEPLASIGAKGLFTQELEADLAAGRVDCCVHSLKDLPTESPAGLDIGALLAREDPRDVLVVNHITEATSLEDLPRGSRVGTSSLRRRAQLLALRPDLEVVELRGNVPTRVRKVDGGNVHAAILAAAGLHRLGISQHITAYLEPPRWLPAAGQGAIAVQIRSDDSAMRDLLAPLNDAETALQVTAERAFLGALEGGCQVPIGALATTVNGRSTLHGFISDVLGKRVLRGEGTIDRANPAESGREVARSLRARGALDILDGLRRAVPVPSPQPE